MRKLNVSLMSLLEVDRAFPLIRAVCPQAELEAWRSFARQRIANEGSRTGILVVENEQACIVGVSAYQLLHDLIHGPVLYADQFCALDIVDQSNIARALENGIEKIARRHGCSAVHTIITSSSNQLDDGWLCTVLHERGHRIEGLHLCKLIPA